MRNTAVAHPRVEVSACSSQYFCSVLLFSDGVMLPVHRRDARAAAGDYDHPPLPPSQREAQGQGGAGGQAEGGAHHPARRGDGDGRGCVQGGGCEAQWGHRALWGKCQPDGECDGEDDQDSDGDSGTRGAGAITWASQTKEERAELQEAFTMSLRYVVTRNHGLLWSQSLICLVLLFKAILVLYFYPFVWSWVIILKNTKNMLLNRCFDGYFWQHPKEWYTWGIGTAILERLLKVWTPCWKSSSIK